MARAARVTVPEDGAEETRDRILRVANALFYQHGYSGTSLAAIADGVGISAPALYWHFSSKEEICFTAVHAELSRFVDAFGSCRDESAPPAARLSMFVRTYVRQKLEQSEWLVTPGATASYGPLRDALGPEYREQLDLLQREVLVLLRSILAAGHEARTFRFAQTTTTAFAILTMCEYVFVWVRRDGPLASDHVADLYRDMVLAMVGCAHP
ncbi:TetR/AcrR family transcriptional regulator [Capillimicrobium parvum]|uniref:HTH tetR-type domain-containing protein n=1 Tax=Capillimicrobium parvum TaxID=2884022 RepID=A0A9E6Y1N0_9ACTN|nr:TetR/AcrR family transcriptional regulator [Capillimicrobium parvum]UGS38434.1 hypothetical protein DSM104329_04862 [Capillimicrobium parvum]